MSSRSGEELDTLLGGRRKRKGCCTAHPRLCSAILVVVGVVCLAIVVCGSVLHGFIDSKVQDQISEQVKLKEGSAATSQFKHSSAPMYTIYYFFNITNPDEVANQGAIPNLVQLGPYAYRENRTCYDLRWHDNNSVLEYKTSIIYTFDPSKSNGHPDVDKITTVNTPLIGFFKVVEDEHSKFLDDVMEVLDKVKKEVKWDGLFIRRTVTELLFGYDDPLLKLLHDIISVTDKILHIALDLDPSFNYSQQSAIEAPNLVHTGVQNLSKANQYIMWNGNYNMSKWNNSWAAAINGTGGYAFHPQVTKDEVLYVFIDEVFRSGYFTFDSEMLDHGIKLYKYVLPYEELQNTTQKEYGFPSNNPSGVLDLTLNIDHQVPMFASKPHFLHADPVFLQNVTGLHPNASIHDSYIGVEPITGAVLNAAKRIQLNLNLKRSTTWTELKNLRDVTMLPIYYAEQSGKVTPDLANDFKEKVYAVKYGISGGVWALVGVAGVVLCVCVMCLLGISVQTYRYQHDGTRLNQYAATDS